METPYVLPISSLSLSGRKNKSHGMVWQFWIAFFLFLGATLGAGYWLRLHGTLLLAFAVMAAAGIVALFGIFRLIRAHAAVERDNAILLEVLEGSRGARLITNPAGKTVYANQRFKNLCADLGEPGLKTLEKLFAAEDGTLEEFRETINTVQRGYAVNVDLEAVKEDRPAWISLSGQPITGWAGFVHWRIDDITERRSSELSLQHEREKLLDFTDNAPVGFFSADEEGRFLFINATLARWLGADMESLLCEGRVHAYLYDPPENARPYDLKPEGGTRQITECYMKGPAGNAFLVSIAQAVVQDPEGRVRTRAVVHDLTAERAMRQALKDSEDRFQRFFEEAPLGIALMTPQGILSDVNMAFARLTGGRVADLEGKDLAALLPESHRERIMQALRDVEGDDGLAGPIEVTLNNLSVPSKTAFVQLYARRFSDSADLVLHLIDISEQKSLEQQFVESQKMQAIGQLAGGVAHDFNNLLTAMTGYCDLLLLRHKPGDPSFGDIMQIKQNANRAANLVRQLLAFSRQQTLQPQVLDVTETLIELSHLLRRLIGAGIQFEVVHARDLWQTLVDPGQLEQVLINLAVNARDAITENGGGQLTLRTQNVELKTPRDSIGGAITPGQWVTIAVEDDGTGIPEEVLQHIFEPFFTTKDVGAGTGLGLATVYGIVRQTGGYIHVDSAPGKGTTFTLYLPRHVGEAADKVQKKSGKPEDEVRQVQDDTAPSSQSGVQPRILLVEDEDAVRSFAERALVNKGYEVIAASGGEEALDKLKQQAAAAENPERPFDLLVTDVVMPEMDGTELVRHVRQDFPDLKVIYISGYTEDRLKEYMGADMYFLAKPFTLKGLAAKVKDVLEPDASASDQA